MGVSTIQPLELIPKELMMDILSRLPVKSLLQFKLVSKSWNSLISNTDFVKVHLRRRRSNPLVIFCPPYFTHADISSVEVNSFLKAPLTPITHECQNISSNWNEPYWVIGSCDGLLCLIGTHCSIEQTFFWVCFWNPITRSISLNWHVDNPYIYVNSGFGYDQVSDTYKALFLYRNEEVFIFNMGSSNWRHVGCFPSDFTSTLKGRATMGVHIKGTLNWIAVLKIYENNFDGTENEIKWVDNGSCVILSFDLNKEEFVRLLLPVMPHKFGDLDLGVLDECLCVSMFDKQYNFMIWQMKKFGVEESWTKLFSINYWKEIEPLGL
ncbi:F-box/kelch-repeat protein At3g23880-like [Lotus japonicus]|uniref:F-box/kelch-repeat protein At3g23880-like n=1 Tax=Lotus japonicus TaxID=34305 RepID=UPI002589BD1E|nr:F-box/kelch-repeat protein At3g23880-like [Lotus japonicus]